MERSYILIIQKFKRRCRQTRFRLRAARKISVSERVFSICILNYEIILELTEMLPGILNQLGAESLTHLKKLANNVTNQYKAGEEEIPGACSSRADMLVWKRKQKDLRSCNCRSRWRL